MFEFSNKIVLLLFKLASNIELVNLGKDSLIASLNGTLNIHNTKTSLTSAENQLNQQRYVCGEFNVSKLINELIEQIVSFKQNNLFLIIKYINNFL